MKHFIYKIKPYRRIGATVTICRLKCLIQNDGQNNMKAIPFCFWLFFCASVFAGPNPGVPTTSIKESRKSGLFIAAYSLYPNTLKLGNLEFPISEAWLESASDAGFLVGRKKRDGYVVVMKIEITAQVWPFQQFSLWSPGADYDGSVGLTFYTNGPVIMHSRFKKEPQSPSFEIKKEPERMMLYSIKLDRK